MLLNNLRNMSTGKVILILIVIAVAITIVINIVGGGESSNYIEGSNNDSVSQVNTVTIDGVPASQYRTNCLQAGFAFADQEGDYCHTYDNNPNVDSFPAFCESEGGTLSTEEASGFGASVQLICSL